MNKNSKQARRRQAPSRPRLRFSPTAWAKLVYLRDRGPSEVGGFAVSSADNPLQVKDLWLVRQVCTGVSVVLDDQAVADYFDRQVEAGLKPDRFGRLWWHTHPGQSAQPSRLDEETFARVFARTDWALMFILAQGGQSYARLRFTAGPGGALVIPVAVDFGQSFAGSDFATWEHEYQENVVVQPVLPEVVGNGFDTPPGGKHPGVWPGLAGLCDDWPEETQPFWEDIAYES